MRIQTAWLAIAAMFIVGAASGSALVYANRPTEIVEVRVQVPVGNDGSGFTFEYPKNPTKHQAQLLGLAYDIGHKDGHEYPQLVQGILLQETRAGDMKRYKVAGQEYGLKPMKRYYGVMQVKLSATRAVLRKFPELKKKFGFHTATDDEVIAKLIENEVFNITVASKYLLILRTFGYSTMQELATAYNKGPGGAEGVDAEENEYAQAVMTKVSTLQPKS